jgi:hypothetical protein
MDYREAAKNLSFEFWGSIFYSRNIDDIIYAESNEPIHLL